MVLLGATVNASETPMADTIKTGTTLIEEGTRMLESLQFESEPWTSFYMAGEIIRESRKASGKQSQYGSEGDKAHSDNVIDHDDHPRDVEEVEFKTFGCGSAIASSSLANEWVKGKTSRKHWPSRTRISSARVAFPRANLLDATRYSRIGGRLHLVGSPIF
jgi:hypothetical protein